jgi:hypothetical protein
MIDFTGWHLHGILVSCRRSLSPGFCAANQRSGGQRRTLPQEVGPDPIQSSKAKVVLDSWDGLLLFVLLGECAPFSAKFWVPVGLRSIRK